MALEIPRRNTKADRFHGLRRLLAGTPLWPALLRSNDFRDAVSQTVRRWQPDLLQAEFLAMGQYLDVASHSARVLRVHDTGVSSARERFAESRGLRRVQLRADLRAWARYEPEVCGWADSIVVFTERDSRELTSGPAPGCVSVIPPDVECPPRALDPVGMDPPEVLFLGNFSHRPNIDAALRLIESIFPAVRRSIPGALLRVVGPSPPKEISRRHDASVMVTGRVDSVEPWLDRAALFCAPLRYGGGVRMKVMEALAAGKAVVASRRALEGIDAVAGDEAVLAETDAEFTAAIVRLLQNPVERRSIGSGGRRWAERRSAISQSNKFDALYRELTRARPGAARVPELAR